MTWEPVIGLEIHVHLKTRTKMFCRCPVGFGAGENTQTCPVCLGFPGALPVTNRRAVEWTVLLGLALGCEIAGSAMFSRKHYPYPDLPKGYQISQYDLPSCINGKVLLPTAEGDRVIGIVRAHLEEDAAKTVHVGGRTGRIGGADYSLIDFNRGGTPLVEIVTAPDIRSADEARRFLQLLRQTIVELGISDAEMEKGALRADANVSVRPEGSEELRTRTELKNMNSFNFIARGIEAEVERQIGVWESGGEVRQETYDFDAATGTLTPRRAKEEADDYRYFPEPDLVPLEPDDAWIARVDRAMPQLPAERRGRLADAAGVEPTVGAVGIAVERRLDDLALRAISSGADPARVLTHVEHNLAVEGADLLDPARLASLVILETGGELTATQAKTVLAEMVATGDDPAIIAKAKGFEAMGADALDAVVDEVIAANAEQWQRFVEGDDKTRGKLSGFFVGQIMKATKGQADGKAVTALLRQRASG